MAQITDVEKVILFAKQAHANRTYKNMDYFEFHVCGVMQLVQEDYTRYGVSSQIALILNTTTILHDVIEDSHKTFADVFNVLKEAGYGANEIDLIIRSLMLLTRDKEETYEQYVNNLLEDTCARFVKKADATFNMRECISDGNYEKAKRYLKVLCRISEWENEN